MPDDNPYASPKTPGARVPGPPLNACFWPANGMIWVVSGCVWVAAWQITDLPENLVCAILNVIIGCLFIWVAGVESQKQREAI